MYSLFYGQSFLEDLKKMMNWQSDFNKSYTF